MNPTNAPENKAACAEAVRFSPDPGLSSDVPQASGAGKDLPPNLESACALQDSEQNAVSCPARNPGVYVFNPFSEGFIAQGPSFTPVKHQVMLASDLANLPQFLCSRNDIVLIDKRPSPEFLETLTQAGFPTPEFVEQGQFSSLNHRKLSALRPWAWGPDSLKTLAPLFAQLTDGPHVASDFFNSKIATLYSKAWSAGFLKKALNVLGTHHSEEGNHWLCSEQEAGTPVNTMADALAAIAAIRDRGHHRVVVKTAYGLAGHNAIRLWENDLLPAQRQWLERALDHGRTLVVEPWLERVMDFSVQLEMGPDGLALCGYTGLINDLKGQFLANWARAGSLDCPPVAVTDLFHSRTNISSRIQHFYGELRLFLSEELQRAGFTGPINIDAFVYRTPNGDSRIKPVVEINPRYTMGRLTVELMQHASHGTTGLFRLVNLAQVRAEGCADLATYAGSLTSRHPLCLETATENQPTKVSFAPVPATPIKIRQGALCLNDPSRAQVCLATFEVSNTLNLPDSLRSHNPHRTS